MPPNALTVSHANAPAYEAAHVSSAATPHGLLCFTITHAFAGSAIARSSAAQVSSQLLKDISLPWSTSAPCSTPGPAASA